MTLVIAISCTYLAWAIWVRRRTLRPEDEHAKLTERTITVSLILQFAALLLMSPASGATVGRALHGVFGQWNLDTYIGHCLNIAAAGLIGVNVASRLNITDDQLRAAFTKHFARPMTLVVAVTMALIVKSPQADRNWADFFDCPLDNYLTAYWALACGFIAYLLGATILPLWLLRRDPRNRRTATIYIGGCTIGVAACVLRIVTLGSDINCGQLFWVGDGIIAMSFAYASSHSWRQKQRQLIGQ
ncbi:hypothetical protein [Mycobacterium sp. 1245499.0]|uniref:hypothetical protein n=1 Tax=Mycobacterium sp. 1245499.0 TaxID=1834074 RepID=UPI000AB02D3A|nr:hypothetical protein [Mycobacterium sp. 1245499.0]